MLSLVIELANEQQSEVIRQQAGLYVKVQLSAEDDAIREHKLHQWNHLDEAMKAQIKAGSMQVWERWRRFGDVGGVVPIFLFCDDCGCECVFFRVRRGHLSDRCGCY